MYIDALVGNAGRWGGAFLFSVQEKGHELFDSRHGKIPSVISCKKGLSLQVEEEDCRSHVDGTFEPDDAVDSTRSQNWAE